MAAFEITNDTLCLVSGNFLKVECRKQNGFLKCLALTLPRLDGVTSIII